MSDEIVNDPDVGPDRYYKTIGDKKASYSKEDEIGPHWGDPMGCCFGECDTWFSHEFREYHGLQEAYRLERWEGKKAGWALHHKYDRRKPRRRYGCAFCYEGKTKHDVPKRLRYIFKNSPC